MRKSSALVVPTIIFCGLVGLVIGACGDDDDVVRANPDASTGTDSSSGGTDSTTPPVDSSGGDTSTATTGIVIGNATYTGTQTGTWSIGVFQALNGSPPLVSRRSPAQTFPATHTFPTVPPGMYFVTTFLDVNNDNLQGPGATDPKAPPKQITVVAGQTVTVDFVITDAISDAGTDGEGGDG